MKRSKKEHFKNKKEYNLRCKQEKKYELGKLITVKITQYGPGFKLKSKLLGAYRALA